MNCDDIARLSDARRRRNGLERIGCAAIVVVAAGCGNMEFGSVGQSDYERHKDKNARVFHRVPYFSNRTFRVGCSFPVGWASGPYNSGRRVRIQRRPVHLSSRAASKSATTMSSQHLLVSLMILPYG